MKKTIKVIYERVKSPTPKFWKQTRNYMLAIGGGSTIIVLCGSLLPLIVVKLASYGITIGVFGTALSQLAKVKEDDAIKANRLTTIKIVSYKDTNLHEVAHDLGLGDEVDDIFEYGEFLNATLIVDENLNILGGKINRHKLKK